MYFFNFSSIPVVSTFLSSVLQMGNCRYVAEYAIARMQAARQDILDLLNERVPMGEDDDVTSRFSRVNKTRIILINVLINQIIFLN